MRKLQAVVDRLTAQPAGFAFSAVFVVMRFCSGSVLFSDVLVFEG
jgi:hypothetical protein